MIVALIRIILFLNNFSFGIRFFFHDKLSNVRSCSLIIFLTLFVPFLIRIGNVLNFASRNWNNLDFRRKKIEYFLVSRKFEVSREGLFWYF